MFQSLRDSLVRLADYLPTSRAALRRGLAAVKRDDFAGALRVFQRLADRGNAEALHHLGWMYIYGLGVAADEDKGMEFMRASADAGYAPAQGEVAECYMLANRGFPMFWNEAFAYAERAEAQGHYKGLHVLLRICEHEGFDERAAELVRKWLDRPRLNRAFAAYLERKLADYHSQGRGMPVDDDSAFALYQRAAAGGNEEARVILEALGGDSRRHPSYAETTAYLQQYVAALPDPMPLSSCNGVSRTIRRRTLTLENYRLRLSGIAETTAPGGDVVSREVYLHLPVLDPERAGPRLTRLYWFDQADDDGNPKPRAAIVYLDPWEHRAEPLFANEEWDHEIIPLWEAGENPDAAQYENHEFICALRHVHRLLGIAPPLTPPQSPP